MTDSAFLAYFARHWTLSTNPHLLEIRQLLRLSTPSVVPIVKQVIEILPGVVLGVLTPRFPTYLGKLRSYVP